jgi:general secretion pathway protein I
LVIACRPAERGITLLEVVVALAVLAVVLGAAIAVVARAAETQGALEQRTLAHWVATNRLAEVLLEPESISQDSGIEMMQRQLWQWRVREEATGNPRLRRVIVSVSRQGTNAELITTSGYRVVGGP